VSKAAVNISEYDWFLRNVSTATSRVLLVDYDGTLAPFSANRQRAFPYRNIPELLRKIQSSCNTRLIITSGRSAREVGPLLGLYPPPEIWGTHGIERLYASGRYEQADVSEDTLKVLEQSEDALERAGLGEQVEVKLAAVAVHWRGMTPSEIIKIRTTAYRVLEPLAVPFGLLLAEFEEGVEIRLREANKGMALKGLLSRLPPDVPVAYLGDDITDEDAFRALNGRGLSILVNAKPRFTAAKLVLRPPEDVAAFLSAWITACGGGS
jgi:trehalose-phosphatase